MWALSYLPEWVFHAALAVGACMIVIGWVLNFFPVSGPYRILVQICGVILTLGSVWYEGGIAKDAEYAAQIEAYQTAVKIYQAEIENVNTTVQTKVITKIKIIKEAGDSNIVYIDKNAETIDKECKVPKEVIVSHNAAAMNIKIEEIVPADIILEHNKLATVPTK